MNSRLFHQLDKYWTYIWVEFNAWRYILYHDAKRKIHKCNKLCHTCQIYLNIETLCDCISQFVCILTQFWCWVVAFCILSWVWLSFSVAFVCIYPEFDYCWVLPLFVLTGWDSAGRIYWWTCRRPCSMSWPSSNWWRDWESPPLTLGTSTAPLPHRSVIDWSGGQAQENLVLLLLVKWYLRLFSVSEALEWGPGFGK